MVAPEKILVEMEGTQAKDANQAEQDQVDRNDQVQELGHDQDQDAGDQGQQRAHGEMDVHVVFFLVFAAPRITWGAIMNKLKLADRPDSVTAGCPAMTAIPLGRELLHGSSFLPARSASHINACLFGIAPGGGYRVSP